nr:amiloride-sensitive amine oxidase [copper-containing] isoform X1 [Taeniopygia guttata]
MVALRERGALSCAPSPLGADPRPHGPQDAAAGAALGAGPAGHRGLLGPLHGAAGPRVHLRRPVPGGAAGRAGLPDGAAGAGAVPEPGGTPGQELAVPGGAAAAREALGAAVPGARRGAAAARGSCRALLRGAGGAQRHRAGRGAPAAPPLLPGPAAGGRPGRAVLGAADDPAGVRAAARGAGGRAGPAGAAAARSHRRLRLPELLRPLPHLLRRGPARAGPRRAPQLAGDPALRGGLLPAPRGAGGAAGAPRPRPAALGRAAPLVQRALLRQRAGAGREPRAGGAAPGPPARAPRPPPLLQLRAPRPLPRRGPRRGARSQGVRAAGPPLPPARQPAGVRRLEPGVPAALLRRPAALRRALRRPAARLRAERAGGHRLLRRPLARRHADQVHGRGLGHGRLQLRAGERRGLPRDRRLPGRPPPPGRRRARALPPRPLRLRAAHGRSPAPPLRQRLPGRLPLLRGAGGTGAGAQDHLHRLQLRLHLGLPALPQRRPGDQGPRHRLHPRHLLHARGPALRQPRAQPPPGQRPHPPGALQGGPGCGRLREQLRDDGHSLREHLQPLERGGARGAAAAAPGAAAAGAGGRAAAGPARAPVPALLQPAAAEPLGPPPHPPPAAQLPRGARAAPRLPRGARRHLGQVPPGRDTAPRERAKQQQHLQPEQPLGPPGHLRELHPRQRDHRGPGPGGLGDRGLPARAPRRGHPQHGHPRQRRRLLPAPLQLLQRGPVGGVAGAGDRAAPGPAGLLPPADPPLGPGQPRALRAPRALLLQRHLPPGVTGTRGHRAGAALAPPGVTGTRGHRAGAALAPPGVTGTRGHRAGAALAPPGVTGTRGHRAGAALAPPGPAPRDTAARSHVSHAATRQAQVLSPPLTLAPAPRGTQ